MRFNCGRPIRERYRNYQISKFSKWHRYFVWWPTRFLDSNDKSVCVWLGFVWRKGSGYVNYRDGDRIYWWWYFSLAKERPNN